MLHSEIIAVFSHIHTKHINTLCGQKVAVFNVEPCGIYSNHQVLYGQLAGLRITEVCFSPSHTD
jgi:hypothetical protein